MATNTIIIESNRKIAYKDELDAIDVVGIQNVERQERISNNRWTTHIPSGLEVNVGDQINLEAAMINSVGGGDSVMEFTGKGGNGGTDLQMNMVMSYYITNRQQFNFNLPMFGMKIITQVYSDAFGSPDFVGESAAPLSADPVTKQRQQYTQFKKSYPLETLQGFSVTVGASEGTPGTPGNLPNAVYSMGSYGSYDVSPLRYYYSQDWSGGYISYEGRNDSYSKFTKLGVPLGFSTPAAIGERLTSQLHARDGNADNWSFSTVNPQQFFIDAGVLKQRPLPGVTDQSYLTIPTSTGTLLYGRQTGKWSARMVGETGYTEGDGYDAEQGRQAFWSNMLCANPDEAFACDTLKGLTSKPGITPDISINNIDAIHLDTGIVQEYVNGGGNKVGEFGNRMCLYQNDLPSVKKTGLTWVQSVTDTQTHIVPNNPTQAISMSCLNLPQNYGVVSNVVWNDITTNLMNIAFEEFHSCDDDTGVINVDDPEYLSKFYVRWKIGRKDDECTVPRIQQQHYLTNALLNAVKGSPPPIYEKVVWNVVEGNITPVPTAAQECSYILKSQRTFDNAGVRENRPCLPGFIKNGNVYDYYIYFKYYTDLTWTPESAQLGTLNVGGLQPQVAGAEFTTRHPNGLEAQKKVWATMGNDPGTVRFGYIPVYKVPSGAPDTDASPIPYMCFVTQSNVDPDNFPIPKPVTGEFMGLSPSMNYNLFSKPINIQKYTQAANSENNGKGYDQLGTNDTVDYYPFCHIGSNDPSITFGDNGRFEIQQFHTPIRSGNGTFNLANYPASTDPETNVATVSTKEANVSGVFSNGASPPVATPTPFIDIISTGIGNNSVMSTQSGMAIERIENFTEDLSSPLLVQNFDTRAYKNTLFYKLGFSLEQLMPIFGQVQNDFNRGNYNLYVGTNQPAGLKLVNMVKPMTTNAYISSAIIPSMIKGAGWIQDNQNPPNVLARPLVPMPLLGGLGDYGANTNIESDILIALRMPQKLDYPYLVVYTDIVRDAQYIGGATGHQKLSAIAYITRNYAEGDYFYSFSTGWTYTADTNYVITDITTDIRLPDGSPAPLDDNSSVIYKVIKNKQMPLNPELLPKILKK